MRPKLSYFRLPLTWPAFIFHPISTNIIFFYSALRREALNHQQLVWNAVARLFTWVESSEHINLIYHPSFGYLLPLKDILRFYWFCLKLCDDNNNCYVTWLPELYCTQVSWNTFVLRENTFLDFRPLTSRGSGNVRVWGHFKQSLKIQSNWIGHTSIN